MQRGLATAFIVLWAASALSADDYSLRPALSFNTPTKLLLLDITRCDRRLLAVGERGAILYSDDNGSTWQQAAVPVSQTLTAITCAPGSSKHWAVGHGGLILHSADAGESWEVQFDGNDANTQWLDYTMRLRADLEEYVAAQPEAMRGELALDLEDATFAVEDATLAQQTGPADPFLDVWFQDTSIGIAVGAYGMLYRTRDGGSTWALAVNGIDNPDRYHYYALTASGGSLFLCGEAGILYRSRDLGRSWETLEPGYAGSLFGLLDVGGDALLVFGLRGNILRSDDGGASFSPVSVVQDPRQSLYGAGRLADGRLILTGAAGALLGSHDSGLTFAGRTRSDRSTVTAVVQAPSGELAAVGINGLQLIPAHAL